MICTHSRPPMTAPRRACGCPRRACRAVRRHLRRGHHAGADRRLVLTARVLDREVDWSFAARSRISSMIIRPAACCSWSRPCGAAPTAGTAPARLPADRAERLSDRRQPRALAVRLRYLRQLDRIRDRRERGRRHVSHPVRAQVFMLPGGLRLLVGTDILERHKLASRLRTAMLWGAGSSVLLATASGSATAAASAVVSEHSRAPASRSWPATCRGACRWKIARRVRRARHGRQPHARAIELQTDMLRTTFDSAAHDLRGPRLSGAQCASKSLCSTKA